MALAARWIRLQTDSDAALRAAFIGFTQVQGARSAPAVLWARERDERFAYALIAPLRLAPGRSRRWRAWALAPSIATYRQFGARAYLDRDEICLSGRAIAASEAVAVGDCAVIASSFLGRLPQANGGWTERNVLEAFRRRIEAQHGWQFDHSWPTAAERAAVGGALAVEATGAQ